MKRIMTSDMLRYRFVKFVLSSFVSTTATATSFTATILPLLLPLLLIQLFLLIPIQQPPLLWQSLTLTATIGITKSTTGNVTLTQCFLLPLRLPALFQSLSLLLLQLLLPLPLILLQLPQQLPLLQPLYIKTMCRTIDLAKCYVFANQLACCY